MNGADKIVPVVEGAEVLGPCFAAREPVAFQSAANGDFISGVDLSGVDPVDVVGNLAGEHPPVIEGF